MTAWSLKKLEVYSSVELDLATIELKHLCFGTKLELQI